MSTTGPIDPRWPKLLSLTVHEFRTPMTVVSGYIRMLLKDRAGPLTEAQRKLLLEAEKSCARLSALIAEVSDLSTLESGTTTFGRAPFDLRALVAEAIQTLPELPDREMRVELSSDAADATMQGDAGRLRSALASIIAAVRRELVSSDRLHVRLETRDETERRIAVAEVNRIDQLLRASPSDLITFDEWRGGCGLSLAIARRVIAAHGGGLWSPADGTKASAVISLKRV